MGTVWTFICFKAVFNLTEAKVLTEPQHTYQMKFSILMITIDGKYSTTPEELFQ